MLLSQDLPPAPSAEQPLDDEDVLVAKPDSSPEIAFNFAGPTLASFSDLQRPRFNHHQSPRLSAEILGDIYREWFPQPVVLPPPWPAVPPAVSSRHAAKPQRFVCPVIVDGIVGGGGVHRRGGVCGRVTGGEIDALGAIGGGFRCVVFTAGMAAVGCRSGGIRLPLPAFEQPLSCGESVVAAASGWLRRDWGNSKAIQDLQSAAAFRGLSRDGRAALGSQRG